MKTVTWQQLFLFLGFLIALSLAGPIGFSISKWMLVLALLVAAAYWSRQPLQNFFNALGGAN